MSKPISVTISLADSAPKLGDFGSIAIFAACPYAVNPQTFTADPDGLAAMVDAGFAVTSEAYQMMSALAAQNGGQTQAKIYPRAAVNDQTLRITPTNTTEGFTYTFTVEDSEGSVDISYTVEAADTVETILDEFATQLAALTDTTVTDSVTHIDLEPATAGNRIWLSDWQPQLTVKEQATDAGIATDLAAGVAADPDFYGFLIDSSSEAEINAATTWANANKRQFIGMSNDSDVATNSTTDVGSDVQTANGNYAKVMYATEMKSRVDCALMGRVFGGNAAFGYEFLRLQGVGHARINATQEGFLDNKLVGYMKLERGETYSRNTKFPNRYPDITRGFDWFADRVSAAALQVFLNGAESGGVPFTNAGIGRFSGALMAQAVAAVDIGLLTNDPAPRVEAVFASAVDPLKKAARELEGIKLYGVLAGKVEKVAFSIFITP